MKLFDTEYFMIWSYITFATQLKYVNLVTNDKASKIGSIIIRFSNQW